MVKFQHNINILSLTFIACNFVACDISKYKEPVLPDSSKIETSSNISITNKLDRALEIRNRSEDFLKYKRIWSTEILRIFKERSLENISNTKNETYRFIWIPSFESAIAIRVWKSKDHYFLVSKKVGGEGYEMKNLSYENTKTLTKEQWLKFIELIDQSSFWDLPSIDIDEEPSPDGATYAIEANKNNKFHEVHRINQSKKIREIGAYLLELSELKTGYKDY